MGVGTLEHVSILDGIRSQLQINSQRIAYAMGNDILTFENLWAKALGFSEVLREHHKIVAGSKVAVYQEMTIDFPWVILGIYLTGATYVPVDIETPKERFYFYLKQAAVDLVITDQKALNFKQFESMETCNCFQLDLPSNVKTKITERSLDKLLYIIFTSGSTGLPKGVMIEEASFLKAIHAFKMLIQLDEDDVILNLTSVHLMCLN